MKYTVRIVTLLWIATTFTVLADPDTPSSSVMMVTQVLPPPSSTPAESEVPFAKFPQGVVADIHLLITAFQTKKFDALADIIIPEIFNFSTKEEFNSGLVKEASLVGGIYLKFADSAKLIPTKIHDYLIIPVTLKILARDNSGVIETQSVYIFRKDKVGTRWYYLDGFGATSRAGAPYAAKVIPDLMAVYTIPKPIVFVAGNEKPVSLGQNKPATDDHVNFKEVPIDGLPDDLQKTMQLVVTAYHKKDFSRILELTKPEAVQLVAPTEEAALAHQTKAMSKFTNLTMSFGDHAKVYSSSDRDYVILATTTNMEGTHSIQATTTTLFVRDHAGTAWYYVDCNEMASGHANAWFRTKYFSDLPASYSIPITIYTFY